MTTTDLSKFGYRELDMAGDLLKAVKNGLPDDFNDCGVTVMMNQNSGEVFLTNEDCQVAMVDDGQLYSFYSTPYEGLEGSFEDLAGQYPTMHEEDQQYMHDLAEYHPTIKLPKLVEAA